MLRFSGGRLESLRKAKQWSMRDMAREMQTVAPTAAGATWSSIAKWEQGIANPRADTVGLLATVLGCSVADLYE